MNKKIRKIGRRLRNECISIRQTPDFLEITFDMRPIRKVRREDYKLYSEYLQEIDYFLDIFMHWHYHHEEKRLRRKYYSAFCTQWLILREFGKNAVDHSDWSVFTCKRIVHEDLEESIDWNFLSYGRAENPEHLRKFYKSLTLCDRELAGSSKTGKGGNHNGGMGTMIVMDSACGEGLHFPVNIEKAICSPFIWLKYSGLWHGHYPPKTPQQ